MRKFFLLTVFYFLTIFFSFGQATTDAIPSVNSVALKKYNSLTVGGGFNNFIMHGDLRSMGTSDGANYWNFGGYIYIDKMFNPLLGLEGKLSYMRMSGGAQPFNNDAKNYTPSYVTTTNSTSDSFVTNLNNLIFEGTSVGGELNVIIRLSNLYKTVITKWHTTGYVGVGSHFYNSRLGEKNLMPNENGANTYGEKFFSDADFGFNPRKNTQKKAMSIYLSAQFGLKRSISNRIDVELRTGMYFNCEDHLDAAISRKQNWETFFVSSLGVALKLGKSKTFRSFVDQGEHRVGGGDFKIIDSDGDGVIDQLDVAANTPAGVMVYGNGKPIDSDRDGLPDYKDKCALKFGPIANGGCPRKENPTRNIEQQIALLAASIYFDTNSDQIKRISFAKIDKIVKLMKQIPDVKYIIEGHTDNTNSQAYNLDLSKRRVASVRNYMINEGIPQGNLKIKGYGESRPKYTNNNAGGRELNRRVEIKPINSLE